MEDLLFEINETARAVRRLFDQRASAIGVTRAQWRFLARLKGEPGVEQVARFGTVLHVSGTDKEALRATVKRLEAEGTHRWSRQVAGLEEAFIYLMAGARDNFAAPDAKAA